MTDPGGQMEGWGVLAQAGELSKRGEAFALATVVWRQGPSSGQQGSRAIITEAGELRGWIGGACAEPVVIREAQRVIAEGTARLLLLGTPRPFAFFAWITALADVIAAAAPFTQPAPLASKVFTAIINIVVGVAVISLLSGVGRSAARPVDVPSPGGPMTTRRDASI